MLQSFKIIVLFLLTLPSHHNKSISYFFQKPYWLLQCITSMLTFSRCMTPRNDMMMLIFGCYNSPPSLFFRRNRIGRIIKDIKLLHFLSKWSLLVFGIPHWITTMYQKILISLMVNHLNGKDYGVRVRLGFIYSLKGLVFFHTHSPPVLKVDGTSWVKVILSPLRFLCARLISDTRDIGVGGHGRPTVCPCSCSSIFVKFTSTN